MKFTADEVMEVLLEVCPELEPLKNSKNANTREYFYSECNRIAYRLMDIEARGRGELAAFIAGYIYGIKVGVEGRAAKEQLEKLKNEGVRFT